MENKNYDILLRDIKEKRERKEKGLYNGILTPFERYKDYFPSIDKGDYIGLLGSTGIGKSKFLRHLAVYNVLEFSRKHKYPVKILYLPLEDPVQSVYKKIAIHYIAERTGVYIDKQILDSKEAPIPDEYLKLIEADKDFFYDLEQNLLIYGEATSPSQIKDACYRFHEKYGKDNHLIVIIDNYSNITKDSHHSNEWEAVRELSRHIIRLDLCKKKQMTVFAVLQVDMESEKNSFRNAGKAMISALEPNMGSIGDVKTIARDMLYLFALFNPARYEIKEYLGSSTREGYRTDILGNRFRSLIHLKSNEGETAPRLGLYFDGGRELFKEMPLLTDTETLKKLYDNLIEREKKRKEKFGKSTLF